MVSGVLGLVVEVREGRRFTVAGCVREVVAAHVAGRNVAGALPGGDAFQLREDGIPAGAKGCEVVAEGGGASGADGGGPVDNHVVLFLGGYAAIITYCARIDRASLCPIMFYLPLERV